MEERVARVEARMAGACARAGRPADSVRLVAVSKTRPPDQVDAAARCGLRRFGENKVQEAAAKIPLCSSALEWHLVGHLQSNKVRLAVQWFSMIHSVDSADLLQRLNRICEEEGRRMPVCLEVNVAGEGSKFGLAPDAVAGVLAAAHDCARIEVVGLMAIPPAVEDPERARGFFRTLRELRDRLRGETDYELPELSMGMSHDFEIAIEEGATFVRVGTDIFGERS
ncbi:MAG: YggS family pyridoxal phosphate-dependent enzyme [Kiritimatiellae bacterium]|nr:YggS family pyridoxal phosphate-dependent enzyme [Kiritimatiellia bacterium]